MSAGLIGQWRRKNPGQKLLLVIDQFEELITLCRQEQEREAFVRELMQALAEHGEVLRIVLTLRSDFEAQISQTDLKEYWQKDNRFVVPPMSQNELREVIEQPASVMVLYFEPHELIDRLINEVIQTPGALPLLSFTLSELYLRYVERQKDVEQQDGNRALTEADYEAIGGVIGSLRRRINQEYETLDEAHQKTMRRVLLRMVAFEGGELTRRRVPVSELDYPDAAENERVAAVIKVLSQARLIVEGSSENSGGKLEAYVEPAHDALIVAWDKLLKWRAEEAETMMLHRHLTQAAMDWERSANKKEKNGLLWDNNPRLLRAQEILELKWSRGTRVTAGHGMFRRMKQFCRVLFPSFKHLEQHIWLNRIETDFIRRSVERKRNWTRRGVAFISAVFVALATAWWRTNNARIEADEQKENAIVTLSKILEEKAKNFLQDAFNGQDADINFQKAWIYTLESLNQDMPSKKAPPDSLNRLVKYNFLPDPVNYRIETGQSDVSIYTKPSNRYWFNLLDTYLNNGRKSLLFQELHELSLAAFPFSSERYKNNANTTEDNPKLWVHGYPMDDPLEWIEQSIAKSCNEGRVTLESLRQKKEISNNTLTRIRLRSMLLKSEKQARQGDYADAKKTFIQASQLGNIQEIDPHGHYARILEPFTNKLNMTFIYIPPGTFLMGSPETEPRRGKHERRHKVTLTKGFYMQTTEVTVGQ